MGAYYFRRGFCCSSGIVRFAIASPPLEIVQCLREIDSCLAGITLPVLVVSRQLVSSSAHPVVFVVRSSVLPLPRIYIASVLSSNCS